MAEDFKQYEFSFSREEAAAAARCEVGTGDLPERSAFWIILAVFLSIGIRIILELPVPPLNVLGMYGATLLLWVLFMIYIRHRLRVTAEELKKRSLILVTDEEGFSVYEFSTDLRYHARFEEITSVERGEYIYRISAPIGRICIPVRTAPAELRDRLEGLEGAEHAERRWM